VVGAHRAVLRLAKRTGLGVGRADIDVLVECGALVAVGEFNGWPTYDLNAVDAVPAEVIGQIVAERESWLRASVDNRTAANALGIRLNELPAWAAACGVEVGRFGRYARIDVDAFPAAGDNERPTATMTRWARQMLEPGVAVVLDTETTDLHGAICEIAVIDAATGTVLLDTLVDPGVPIGDAARRVHGIGDGDVAGAPRWPDILDRLLCVTKDRMILAYHAEYDRRVICAECSRYSVDASQLRDRGTWVCLMSRRIAHLHTDRRLALGGPHRALADCRAALDVLRGLARPAAMGAHHEAAPPDQGARPGAAAVGASA
jgi:DNA polymerase III epsilon subunit-like protein